MEERSIEEIRIGPLGIRYFADGSLTSGTSDCFEFTVPAWNKGTPPHYHDAVDEMVFGVEGRVTFTIGGEEQILEPRGFLFIPRGKVHSFDNNDGSTGVVLCLMTPALIGRDYFREMAALFAGGGRPEPEQIRTVMLRHGLVPV